MNLMQLHSEPVGSLIMISDQVRDNVKGSSAKYPGALRPVKVVHVGKSLIRSLKLNLRDS
jgi:hypothetical protein